jgi:hypothetical protein
MNFRCSGLFAVFDLGCCEDAVEEALAETLDGLAYPVVLDDVNADAGYHEF